jgi:hypothetical protein
MVSVENVKEKAHELAFARLGAEVKDVVVEEIVDSEGRKGLRVTVLIKSKWSADPPGNKLNDISSRLNSYLSSNGDQRFAYTHYMTAKEFSSSHDRRKPTPKRRSAAG